jgi:hypothetical protein
MAEFATQIDRAATRLIGAGLLYAPARALPPSLDRLNDPNRGRHIAIHEQDTTSSRPSATRPARRTPPPSTT